jgi:Negative regulator of sigma F
VALRRGAPLAAGVAGALVGGAAFMIAFGVMRVACRLDELLHLLVFHALPVVVGVLCSVLVGLLLFPRWRPRTRL